MRLLLALSLAALTGPAAAEPLAYRFTWQGDGDYRMEGALGFDSDAARDGIVTEDEVDCFVIEGSHAGTPVGRWALAMLTPETTWTLSFDPARAEFLAYGPEDPMPQAWNMNGWGTDCGAGGFGFNIGNAAQDLCIDGNLITASQVLPDRPFPAAPAPGYQFPTDACAGPAVISRAETPARRRG